MIRKKITPEMIVRIMRLYYIDGMSRASIARHMGFTANAITWHLYGKDAPRKVLTEEQRELRSKRRRESFYTPQYQAYEHSAERRAQIKRYKESEKGQRCYEQYKQTEQFKAYRRRYNEQRNTDRKAARNLGVTYEEYRAIFSRDKKRRLAPAPNPPIILDEANYFFI
jgi:hypothetical protein